MADKARAGGAFLASIPWDKLFAFAEKMLANCSTTGTPPAKLEDAARNPSDRSKKRVERFTKRAMGLKPAEWRQNKDSIMEAVWAKAKAVPAKQAQEIIQRAVLRAEVDAFDSDGE